VYNFGDIRSRYPEFTLLTITPFVSIRQKSAYHAFGEKTAKIGPADPQIICLWEIVKDKKRKKLTQAYTTAVQGTLERPINYRRMTTLISP